MKIITLTGLILGMMLASSCLTSLQPLVTYDTVIEDDRILGSWQGDDTRYKVEKFPLSAIYKEVVGSIKVNGNDPQNAKPLTDKEKKDSILYSHSYSITWQKEGITYYMIGSMTRIGNGLFLEIFPIVIDDPQCQDGNGLDYTFDYVPGSTIASVEIKDNNTLQLHFPSGDVIREQIDNGNMRINHESDSRFGTFLVTASTWSLRSFFEKYGHDERLFGKENSFTLTRKG